MTQGSDTLSREYVSPEHYAEFLERLGHRVRRVNDLYWFNTQRGVYTAFPFHRSISCSQVSRAEILQRDGVLLRYGCPQGEGVASFRMLCADPDYDFPALRSRTRTQVRRGLESCQVEQIDFDLLQRAGLQLNVDTLIRQGRSVPSDLERYWRRFYEAAQQTPGAEAWGAFVDGNLAAYLISFAIEDVANMTIVRSATAHLGCYPNNALVFRFLQERLRSGKVRCVSYGYQSVQSGTDSLDQFKSGMGFIRDAVDQRIEIAAWARPFLNRLTLPAVARLLGLAGNPEQTAKLRGIADWYRQQPTPAEILARREKAAA